MFEVLERFKQLGMYGVHLFYGEGVGCDDSDTPPGERQVRLMGVPAGCLGECKVLWTGPASTLADMNFKKRPKQVSNPPGDVVNQDGYYIWGTEEGVEAILSKPFFGAWED
jgi:hypothetical protein